MNPTLLRNQFETLEEPTGNTVVVDVDASPTKIVETIRKLLAI
jgi:gluconate kinase